MSTVTAAALALELQKLPLHNETALRVIALLDDPDVEVSELGHLIQSDPGLTTRDTEIDGVPIPKGARVVVVYSAANRDPSVFGDPDGFDPDRTNLKEHLAFGKGIHFCLGAPLSRLELSCALVALSRRLGELSLPDTNSFEYHPSFMLRGLTRLDLAFSVR